MGSSMVIKVICEHKKYNKIRKLFSKEGYTYVHSYYENCNQCVHKNKKYKGCKTCTDEMYYTKWNGYAELPELVEKNIDLFIDVWWIDLACTKHKQNTNTKEKWYSIKKELNNGSI